MNKRILPEAGYSLNPCMTFEELQHHFYFNHFVVGRVLYFSAQTQSFKIDLGNGIIAKMPLVESSIYLTSRPDGLLTAEAYGLISKTVCVKILQLDYDDIVVSRKENMLEAFEALSNMEGQVVDCYVKSCLKKMVFVDVGHGISGAIRILDLCKTKINHVLDAGVAPKDFIKAKINTIDSENFHVVMGYKELFEDLSGSFNRNDLISAYSFFPIETGNGYFASVNPNTSAILDPIPGISIPYGSNVIARVKSSAPNKLRLGFISFVS